MSRVEDRVAKHRRMAEAYRDAYKRLVVKDGEKYEEWKFAEDAIFWSPYFTGGRKNTVKLGGMVVDVATYATMEALSYSVKFPDWAPKEFNCWPSENGFVMRTHFAGHHVDTGEEWSFYSTGFVETNENFEITNWQTFVADYDYGVFLQEAIGSKGPYINGHEEYFEAVDRHLKKNGLA